MNCSFIAWLITNTFATFLAAVLLLSFIKTEERSSSESSVHLTYSMVQSPSREADWFAASQEIPRISRNPKVHYRTHKRPPPVRILGQPSPVHIPTSHLLEIHPNIIHPSTPRSPSGSFPPVSPQRPHTPPLLTHTRHMPSPSHSSICTSVHLLFTKTLLNI